MCGEELNFPEKVSVRNEVIATVAGAVAHDVNNLFTAILACLDLIEGASNFPLSLQEDMLNAKASAYRGAEFVGRLLAVTRPPEPRTSHLDVRRILTELEPMLAKPAGLSVELRVEQSSAYLWAVQGDDWSIKQALYNLCLSLRDSMPARGIITVSLENSKMAEKNPNPEERHESVQITLNAEGQPISPSLLRRIRTPASLPKGSLKGAGLGLLMAEFWIREGGGSLEIESGKGRGNTFVLHLPRAGQEIVAHPVEDIHRPSMLIEGQNRGTILILDADEMIRLLARTILNYRGYEVVEADSGPDAISKYLEHSGKIDLVLAEKESPGLDGWRVMARMREHDPGVKLIMMSDSAEPDWGDAALKEGARACLQKPFDSADLVEAVSGVMKRG